MSQQQSFTSPLSPGEPVYEVALQKGTTPIAPTGGVINFNGAVVVAGTHPVQTDGTAVDTMALEVQISQAIAASNAANIGLSAFDSNAFDVDANGFVQLKESYFGKVTTNGAETKTIIIITPSDNSITTIEARISGYGTPIAPGADAGVGGTFTAVFLTGTTASGAIDVPDYFQQTVLSPTCIFTVIPDPTPLSTSILIQVTGDAAYDINWVCEAKVTEAI